MPLPSLKYSAQSRKETTYIYFFFVSGMSVNTMLIIELGVSEYFNFLFHCQINTCEDPVQEQQPATCFDFERSHGLCSAFTNSYSVFEGLPFIS